MTSFNPHTDGFWRQNRLALSLALTAILIIIFAFIRLISSNSNQIRRILRSNIVTKIIKVLRIVFVIAVAVTLILSFRPRVDQELGGILLFFLWSLLLAQAVLGFLPWDTCLRSKPLTTACVYIALQ
jgi:uncharacterized membrane protein (DUF485 family)